SRPLYLQDVLDTLALPPMAMDHFRYLDRWVAQDIKANSDKLDQYRGQECLIVFAQRLTPPSSSAQVKTDIPPAPVGDALAAKNTNADETPFRYFPLRRAYIRKVEVDGTIFHAHVQLAEYVDWGDPARDYDTAIRTLLPPAQRPLPI